MKKGIILGLFLVKAAFAGGGEIYCPSTISCQNANTASCVGNFVINPIFTKEISPDIKTFPHTFYFVASVVNMENIYPSQRTCQYRDKNGMSGFYLDMGLYADQKAIGNKWNGDKEYPVCITNNSYDCPLISPFKK